MNGEPLAERLSRKYEALKPYLNERLRRLFAAAEVLALDRGGKTLISAAFGLSRPTIDRGLKELASKPSEEVAPSLARLAIVHEISKSPPKAALPRITATVDRTRHRIEKGVLGIASPNGQPLWNYSVTSHP